MDISRNLGSKYPNLLIYQGMLPGVRQYIRQRWTPGTLNVFGEHKEDEGMLYTFHESSWLVNSDPYIGFLLSGYQWVVFHPLHNPKQPG